MSWVLEDHDVYVCTCKVVATTLDKAARMLLCKHLFGEGLWLLSNPLSETVSAVVTAREMESRAELQQLAVSDIVPRITPVCFRALVPEVSSARSEEWPGP